MKHVNKNRPRAKKQSVTKKGRNFKTKNSRPKKTVQPEKLEEESASEHSDNGEDMLEMIEDDDMEFLKSAVSNKSYDFLNQVGVSDNRNKSKRRKLNKDDLLEEKYESLTVDTSERMVKPLLPIKTKAGIIPRSRLEESEETASDEDEQTDTEDPHIADNLEENSDPLTTAQLIATRSETLRTKKIEIGSLSASILEAPEEKIGNLGLLLNIMDERTPEVFLTVRKLAAVSLLEVFKDLLPSYEIKPQASDGSIKLKKDTLKLQRYEEALLQYYKKYLRKLEKFTTSLIRKKGDNRIITEEKRKLGQVGLRCMCELLVTHAYFNYSQNIAQAVVPFLNHPNKTVREIVKLPCITVFKEDKKEELTLKVLRIINQQMKKHAHNVQIEMLEVLLALKIKDVDLDRDKEHEIKEKKLLARKQNVLQMSKKERKRKKRLQHLEKELLETKAEENKRTKQQVLTEITKVVFGIYFRILKTSTNTKVLGICLEGLAKYAHCINLEFYVDLVNVLDKLLKEDWLGDRERLHCIQTVFTILSGQGEALNLDPLRFYVALYQQMLHVHAGRTHQNFPVLMRTVDSAIIKRRKKMTNNRLIGFVKRLAILALQLPHGSSLSCLGVVKNALQLNRATDILLDLDVSTGDGVFRPEIEDPEYCNAAGSALFEMVTLHRHYHPVVSMYAKCIISGVPATGDGSLPPQLNKRTPEQLFEDFDMSKMAFNPPVPVPKKVQPKVKVTSDFVDADFQAECKNLLRNTRKNYCSFYIDEENIKL